MTVCVAALFDWNYAVKGAPLDVGRSAIVISDRMITAGDVQYEPRQSKFARMSENVILLISGDYSIHSQAIKDTHAALRGIVNPTPENVATIYGRAIQAIKRRLAEDLYLAPLGLNTDSFIAQQREMSDGLTNALLDRLHRYEGDEVEALIVGTSKPLSSIPSPHSVAQIYYVDNRGSAHCSDDVGFAAIGIGGWHARSRLMQAGYVNTLSFAQALAAVYAAKKSAEVAPGVSASTDIQIVLREAIIPLWPYIFDKLDELYRSYDTSRRELALKAVQDLQDFINIPPTKDGGDNGEGGGQTSSNPQIDVSPSAPAAETARENETRKKD